MTILIICISGVFTGYYGTGLVVRAVRGVVARGTAAR